MSNSPNIDNEKAKVTEDPGTQSSPRPTDSGYVEFGISDQAPERIERLGHYLSHSTKNSSNVDERNATAYGNPETSTLGIPHQSGKTRADFEVSSPDVPSEENPKFLDSILITTSQRFENLGKDPQTFPNEIVESVIPEEDKVSSPHLKYGNGHHLLNNNAKKVTDRLIEEGANKMLVNSRWAGMGQKRFPEDRPGVYDPNVWARTNRYEGDPDVSIYTEYEHPTGQKMSETLGKDMDKFWPEYQRRVGKFGPAMQAAAKPNASFEDLSVENVFEDFEAVDRQITNEELSPLSNTTVGQVYTHDNQFETTRYVHQVPDKKNPRLPHIPIPDVTGPLNHPSIRTAETRMWGSLRSRLSLGNVPSLLLKPPNAAETRKRIEEAGLGKTNYGNREVYNSMLWIDGVFGDVSPGNNNKMKELVGKRYQEREDGRFTPEHVRYMEDMLEAEHMPFYIQDLRTNEVIGFHAFLNSISDSYTGEWSAQKGFGRLEAAQIYGGGSRSIGVSFTMVAMNPADFDEMYVKINKLTTLVYPQWSRGTLMQQGENRFVQPFSQVPTASPLCRIRVGDLFTSNYSKKAMARMMGIEEKEFVYEGMESIPDPAEEAEEKPSGLKEKIKSGLDKLKERNRERLDETKYWLKIHFWSVIQKLLFEYGVPAALMPRLQKLFEANHKSFQPRIYSIALPGVETSKIPSLEATEKAETLIANLKAQAKGAVDPLMELASKVDKDVPEFGLGSLQSQIQGELNEKLKLGEAQVRDDEFVSEAYKQAEWTDEQIRRLKAKEQQNPERPTKAFQLFITIPSLPGLPIPLPNMLPFHNPSFEEQELRNYIGESGYFETNAAPPREEDPVEEEKSTKRTGRKNKKESPKKIIDLFDSQKNPIFKSFESSMGRGIAVAINSIGLEWKLGSAPWNLEVGDRAPRMCEVSLGLVPIHDITPGIDHNGLNRAPIYKVGSSRDETGDVWYNDEEFKELQKNIKRDTLVALVPWGEIVKGIIE